LGALVDLVVRALALPPWVDQELCRDAVADSSAWEGWADLGVAASSVDYKGCVAVVGGDAWVVYDGAVGRVGSLSAADGRPGLDGVAFPCVDQEPCQGAGACHGS